MAIPEDGSPERRSLDERVEEGILGAVGDLVGRKTLPETVHVLYQDEESNEKFGAFVDLRGVGESGAIQATVTGIGSLKPGIPLSMLADSLIRRNPGVPLVCNKVLAEELGGESITWLDQDHYRLEGRPDGVLEVFIPFASVTIPSEKIIPGSKNIRLYTE